MGLGLVTDLYELTMVSSYARREMLAPATFSLFSRALPPGRGFLVAAGLDDVMDMLERFAFDGDDLAWLEAQGFDARTLAFLETLRFTGDVWAVPEGRVVFPDEPLIEVTAPLPEAQIVETLVLNQITYQTALATKAARCRLAVGHRAALVDFSLRRTHGVEAGLAAARAAAIAGFVGTSNVGAARRLGIPAVGTMAHSYIQVFVDERDAFVAFAEDHPGRTTFLVDTYDTVRGVATALDVARSLGLRQGVGIRLDSGDLLDLSTRARRLLDAAGRPDIAIVASGGLDELQIEALLGAGAPIDVFAVGTKVGVSADAPSLDTAYKLVEYDGRPVMKLSPGKATRPGPKQVHRSHAGVDDVVATRTEPAPPSTAPLLVPVMRGGRRVAEPEPVSVMRDRLARDLEALPPAARDLRAEPPPPTAVSAQLDELTRAVRRAHDAAVRDEPND